MNEPRQSYLDYYRPLVGMMVLAVADTVPAADSGASDDSWPVLLVSHPDAPEYEFQLEVSQDPEGNGPGFLFFATGDESEEEIDIEGLKITAVDLLEDQYEDWVYWPTLICDRPGKSPLTITISRDPEGNGAGHLFGVPQGLEIS